MQAASRSLRIPRQAHREPSSLAYRICGGEDAGEAEDFDAASHGTNTSIR